MRKADIVKHVLRWVAGVLLSGCDVLSNPLTPSPTPSTAAPTTLPATLTQQVFLPFVQVQSDSAKQEPLSSGWRVLFINGDHIPESGYPHSRVYDDGSKPESFSRLRVEVLEQELGLQVDEFILTREAAITPERLAPYRLVVLGSNGRPLSEAEVSALTAFYERGGRVLTYADFQYGPDNWESDNRFLRQFGIEVLPDNFQPATVITDVETTHPIFADVRAFGVEGASQFIVRVHVLGDPVMVLAACTPLLRSGCAIRPEEQALLLPGDRVVCTWVRENAAGGKLAGTCDRNTFHNGSGPGSDLDQHDNRTYARNLFRWLTQ
ncbi:MAG: hypothetical protein NZL91_06105 [Thermoflexales bacterium]|nr:hypothetical protein [Thermoflexales bacterium]